MSYQTDAYLITCKTNMHVGSGDTNYGVVDKLVQRDVITEMPAIYSSSLKGALRELFKEEWGPNDEKLNYIFGPDNHRNNGQDENIGHYKFFPADLLCLPVRSNKRPFFRATSNSILSEFVSKANAFGVEGIAYDSQNPPEGLALINQNDGEGDIMLEDWRAQSGGLSEMMHIGEDPALFHHNDFKKLAKKLPVIARNKLENGESKNLWYEEVVPRESRFVFFVSKLKEGENEPLHSGEFDDAFSGKLVQIGANASIGYGYCSIEKIS